jgi:NAD(P)-dependent dehydrogenase (short-subunit alcohol dehydrogenase family)
VPRTIVLTGASDGIGAAAARQLHEVGERVVVVGRDPDKTRTVAERIDAPWHVADFADLSQVRDLADLLRETYPSIDVLANNAGGIFGARAVTVDGFERTFQVNHLGPFLLTNLLLDTLIAGHASVIQTSSAAARRFAKFDIDDLQGERAYTPSTAYGNGKLANVLFTKELLRRYGDQGINPVAFHPGAIASGFASASSGPWRFMYTNPVMSRMLSSAEVGGSRLTWLALGKPGVDWKPGAYYARNKVARTSRLADDPGLAKRLWERSAEMVGL